MKVLVLNCGSSSIKYKLYNMDDESVLAQGGDKFNESVIVDKSVEDGIEELCDLAPVHNAGHL